jgi:signal transduction histidine kinase
MANHRLFSGLQKEDALLDNVKEVTDWAFHRRLMVSSEAVFFVFLTLLGLYILFRALRFEERSKEQQKSFIDIISHESKTPLTALKLRLESIVEENPSHALLINELELALVEVRRLASVFDKALNLNRSESNQIRVEHVSLKEIIENTLFRMEPFFKKNGVVLESMLSQDSWVKGDPSSLQSAFQNLLENAVLYNDKPIKQIQIECRSNKNTVLLHIKDNGPGISKENQSHLFQRFYRGETGRKVAGTGLGLYLTKKAIQAHQGAVRLLEDGLIQGAVFEISLPRSEAL